MFRKIRLYIVNPCQNPDSIPQKINLDSAFLYPYAIVPEAEAKDWEKAISTKRTGIARIHDPAEIARRKYKKQPYSVLKTALTKADYIITFTDGTQETITYRERLTSQYKEKKPVLLYRQERLGELAGSDHDEYAAFANELLSKTEVLELFSAFTRNSQQESRDENYYASLVVLEKAVHAVFMGERVVLKIEI